jgi:hypothetical protein
MRNLTAILLLLAACETEGVSPGVDLGTTDLTGPSRVGGSLVFATPDAGPELTPDARPVAPDTLPTPDAQPATDLRLVNDTTPQVDTQLPADTRVTLDTTPAPDTKSGPEYWCQGNCFIAPVKFVNVSGCNPGLHCSWSTSFARPWCTAATKRVNYGEACGAEGTVCEPGTACSFDAKVDKAVKVCLRVCDLKNTGMTECFTTGGFDEVCVPNPNWKCADGTIPGGVCLTRGSQFVSG